VQGVHLPRRDAPSTARAHIEHKTSCVVSTLAINSEGATIRRPRRVRARIRGQHSSLPRMRRVAHRERRRTTVLTSRVMSRAPARSRRPGVCHRQCSAARSAASARRIETRCHDCAASPHHPVPESSRRRKGARLAEGVRIRLLHLLGDDQRLLHRDAVLDARDDEGEVVVAELGADDCEILEHLAHLHPPILVGVHRLHP